jgi:hypothetical protein
MKGEIPMGVCDVCGNEYAHAFQITLDGMTHTFDSFECAEHNGRIFCGAHCALEAGVVGARDHI